MMQRVFPKQAFLDDLLARNAANLALVQTTFAPLDRAARSTQPDPNEWCVDQCVEHLVLAFDLHLAHMLPLLERDAGVDSAETFTRSWTARQNFYQKQFDPRNKAKTLPRVTPTDHFYPDVYTRFAAQKERFTTILERTRKADLQRRGWFLRFLPVNVGDYLEMFVRHDELHIDQVQRALATHRQFAAA
ncbi:MAG: DinB family protein [Caldilinea sp.]